MKFALQEVNGISIDLVGVALLYFGVPFMIWSSVLIYSIDMHKTYKDNRLCVEMML